ncbi:hypothetical protein LE135_15260 [Escherichia coli]|nr:hypothetical protein [Escherichia coli]
MKAPSGAFLLGV